jgi:hypothetical protein
MRTIAFIVAVALGACAACDTPTEHQPTPEDAAPPREDADTTAPEPTGESRMSSLIFTASSATDQLTIVGHGLVTGDGPVTPRAIGSSSVLPAPLTPVTDYFVIRDSADTLRLATSNANAMGGIAINLTTNGSGTLALEFGLPYRRPRTYVPFDPLNPTLPGSKVRATDFNAVFESLVAMYGALTGQPQSVFSGLRLSPVNAVADMRPAVITTDYAGRARFVIDHLGFPSGQFTQWEEHWRTSGTTLPEGWSGGLGGAGVVTMTAPSASFPQRSIVLSNAAAGSARPVPNYLFFLDNERSVEIETTVRTGTAGLTDFEFGFQFDHAGAGDHFVVLRLQSDFWYAKVVGSATTLDATSVTFAASTTYRLKIEIVGSTLSGASAGTFTARFAVNGALVFTKTFTSPGPDMGRPFMGIASGGVANTTMTVGRLRASFSHVVSGDEI